MATTPKPDKSCLDGIEVVDDAFPLKQHLPEGEAQSSPLLGIVSHCPHCGCPIYGKTYVGDNEIPVVRRTCSCERSVVAGQKYVRQGFVEGMEMK